MSARKLPPAARAVPKRELKRLEAAEELCRCFRKGISYYATQDQYMYMALDWLQVWIKNSPKKVWQSDPHPAPIRKKSERT